MVRGIGVWAAFVCVVGCGTSSIVADAGMDAAMDGSLDGGDPRDASVDTGVTARCGPPGECEIGAGDCPAGQGCQLVGATSTSWHTECEPAGTGGSVDICDTNADCAPGLSCRELRSVSVCLAYCCDAVLCEEDFSFGCGMIGGAGGAGFCSLEGDCHPTDPVYDACVRGEQCYASTGGSTCARPGDLTEGEACSSNPECVAGLYCAALGGAATCLRLCDTEGIGPTCETSERCQQLPSGPPRVGVCVAM